MTNTALLEAIALSSGKIVQMFTILGLMQPCVCAAVNLAVLNGLIITGSHSEQPVAHLTRSSVPIGSEIFVIGRFRTRPAQKDHAH